ncbi:ABC transporter substrate-binding protein [Halomonas cupida]|uniref:ABC transporter substrate-binding protein n=1 Tax=Halomonas cupida TaxID=44933 RepID=A0A1M6ZFV1_9GAMM|nr:sialic acid TRAP transporter substrate-binding protein SiaP [Halomonas cupida]GEN24382.1 ABC transporter substrate-binding protein [Halomonas cupida]SHL29348.1 tripartite ATP-independent transporter solute receptor, DctP family [Halomonas cupida]
MRTRSLLSLSACLYVAFGSGGAQATETVKWAHVYEPSEAYHHWAEWGAEQIAERTDGRYEVEVFPSSTLGKEVDINQGLVLGTVDIIYTGQSFAAQTYGPLALSDAPFVFRDYGHWQAYTDSELFQEFADGYRDASGGNLILGGCYYGLRHVTSNMPIREPADMEGLKIRVPNAPIYSLFPRAVGAQPTPLAFSEVYLALQQGVVDAQENPLPTIRAKKFYEVQDYINLTGHVTGSNLIVAGGIFFNGLSQEDQQIFRDVLGEVAKRVSDDVREQELEAVAWFEEQGTTIVEVDREAFREATLPHLNGDEATWTEEQFDRLQALQ